MFEGFLFLLQTEQLRACIILKEPQMMHISPQALFQEFLSQVMIPALFTWMICEHLAQLGTPHVSDCQDFNSVLEMQTSVDSIIVFQSDGGTADRRSL